MFLLDDFTGEAFPENDNDLLRSRPEQLRRRSGARWLGEQAVDNRLCNSLVGDLLHSRRSRAADHRREEIPHRIERRLIRKVVTGEIDGAGTDVHPSVDPSARSDRYPGRQQCDEHD